MRLPWKLIGLAGLTGVAASGVVVARRHRGQQEYEPEALRERLHARLAATRDAPPAEAADGSGAGAVPPSGP